VTLQEKEIKFARRLEAEDRARRQKILIQLFLENKMFAWLPDYQIFFDPYV
jgi:hypothetical protein